MEPSEKSAGITDFLNHLMNREECIKNNKCTWCGGEAKNFKDDMSEKEYTISGYCQKCQNKTFGE